MTTYQSKPATIIAAQIPDASSTTILGVLAEAFGSADPFYLTENGEVSMVTIQGKSIEAGPGEYIVQEQDDPSRFYPVDGTIFERRWEVQG